MAKTLQRQIAGTRQEDSLVRGTSLPYRDFASEFTDFLLKQGVLEVRLRDRGKRIVRVVPEHREVINGFADDGRIAPILKPFLDKYVRDS